MDYEFMCMDYGFMHLRKKKAQMVGLHKLLLQWITKAQVQFMQVGVQEKRRKDVLINALDSDFAIENELLKLLPPC